MDRLATDGARSDDGGELRELIQRCLQGDEAAILALVEQFQGSVFALCFRMLGHRHDAEDMTQETFVRAIRSLANWDAGRPFGPWLLAIAGNRCRTLLAARGRRPQTLGEWAGQAGPVERQADADDLAEEVQRALGLLRAEYRQAFLLFHQHELGYAEIAAAMNCPVGTAKTWVHRARRELADRLQVREAVETRHELRRI